MDNSKFHHEGSRGQVNRQSDSIDAKVSEDKNRRDSPPGQRRSRPGERAAETDSKAEPSKTSHEVNFHSGFVSECRDAVVMRHAKRLGVLASLTNDSPKYAEATFRFEVIEEGGRVHLLMNHAGRADGDNGLAMITAPNHPGTPSMLRRLAMANFVERAARGRGDL